MRTVCVSPRVAVELGVDAGWSGGRRPPAAAGWRAPGCTAAGAARRPGSCRGLVLPGEMVAVEHVGIAARLARMRDWRSKLYSCATSGLPGFGDAQQLAQAQNGFARPAPSFRWALLPPGPHWAMKSVGVVTGCFCLLAAGAGLAGVSGGLPANYCTRLVQPLLQAVQQALVAEGAAFLGEQGAGLQAVEQDQQHLGVARRQGGQQGGVAARRR